MIFAVQTSIVFYLQKKQKIEAIKGAVMGDPKYFKIKNWEKYQHPRLKNHHGGAPYVRLYTNILDDPIICSLTSESRLTWVLLIALSGRVGVRLRYDSGWVKARLGLKKVPNLALFVDKGLIEILPDEKIREDKIREDKIREDKSDVVIKPENLIEAWNELSGFKAKGLFSGRTDLLVSEIEKIPDLEYWKAIFRQVKASKFLHSKEKKWKTTLEWVMEHHTEIFEGKFTDEDNATGVVHTMPLR